MTAGQGPPDLILYNARVLTVAPIDNIQQAIAIRGELIQAVGNDEDVRSLAGPMTTSVDLEGRTVIPGIIDIHAHMDREGLKRIVPSLGAQPPSTRSWLS